MDAWLSKRYASKRLPPFERNEETLQALLTIATLNDSADEQRSLIDRIEKASLQAQSRRKASGGDDGLQLLLQELEGNAALETLAIMVVGLDCPDADVETIGKAIVDLTSQKFDVEQQALRAEAEVRSLKSQQDKVRNQLEDLKRDDFEPRANLAELTSEWMRNTKQLKAKVGEYDDRLSALSASQQPSVRLEDVTQLSEELSSQQARLAELNTELMAYQSLPSDPKAARAKLESAREELRGLVQERDRLFERLVDS